MSNSDEIVEISMKDFLLGTDEFDGFKIVLEKYFEYLRMEC